jgi:hypothetical protein
VREYRLWSRRARGGPNHYEASLPPYKPRVVPKIVMPSAPKRARLDTAARRRRVLAVMVAAVAAPALVALATGSSTPWWFVLAVLPIVLAYLGFLLRARHLTAEREFNIAFFGRGRAGAAGLEEVFSARQGSQFEQVGAARASNWR